ncbi:DUF3168 domain-containing protein [Parabacteroides sp. AM08-6]|uniref:tail completion protein gp17 n=1 Tax=Parabacteroides sp. AM08-6 TaxID=2292053 RepID=UPI000EFE5586|nr:DUF3168 domain-containing protein [Parabacteroides sp. AM08-6]RHJ76223.1 DUF3168 domain-containing protein [Parabacteroides sp. AM08-6]
MSLLIGNHIFSVLTSDEDVKRIVEERIFPIVVPEQTKKSFVLYDEINVSGEYTKDGLIGDVTCVSVKCASERFETVSILADNVRMVLESSSKQYEGYSIEGSCLKNSTVGYDSGLYVFVLNFEFQTTY